MKVPDQSPEVQSLTLEFFLKDNIKNQ